MTLQHHVSTLESTVGVLRPLLSGHDERLLHANYGPQTWSPFDIVGHLIQGEIEDWVPRARIILEHGVSRAFDSFDHRSAGDDSMGTTVAARLDMFERMRGENLRALRGLELDEARLALRGTHPALGEVTMANLIAMWATHDLHHIAQVCKALAFGNREEVGPWRDYVGILPKETP